MFQHGWIEREGHVHCPNVASHEFTLSRFGPTTTLDMFRTQMVLAGHDVPVEFRWCPGFPKRLTGTPTFIPPEIQQ